MSYVKVQKCCDPIRVSNDKEKQDITIADMYGTSNGSTIIDGPD